MTRATTARPAAQRRRPPLRGFDGGRTGLAGTGPEAHAGSCPSLAAFDVPVVGGVKGAVGCVDPDGAAAGVGTRVVASSVAAASLVPVFSSSVIVAPFPGSSPARQCADGCPFAAAGKLLHEFLH